jgi:hypothetical protein
MRHLKDGGTLDRESAELLASGLRSVAVELNSLFHLTD